MKPHNCYGQIYIEQEEFKKVIEIYTNAINFETENWELYYILGISYARTNNFAMAKNYFKKVIEKNNQQYNAYYYLGQIALLYREFDDAEENFKHSIYKEKKVRSHIELAKIEMLKNENNEAIKNLKNAIETDPKIYKQIQEEPIFFTIKKSIEEPKTNNNVITYDESKLEKETDEYLRNTYNITKILNKDKQEE